MTLWARPDKSPRQFHGAFLFIIGVGDFSTGEVGKSQQALTSELL
jgi:hypothetical protein